MQVRILTFGIALLCSIGVASGQDCTFSEIAACSARDPAAAEKVLIDEAAKGNVSALLALGNFYRSSPSPYANPEKALAAYERASVAGEPWAMVPLAEMLFTGEGGKRDADRALELVGRAEKAGLVGPAQKALGDYYRSTGAFEEAASAYERALATGERGAMLSLAKLLFNGQGTKRDEKRALELVAQAEKAGLVESAQNTLGNYYRYSPPPFANPEKALAAYERASEAGEPWAMIPLAEMLFTGEGGKRDEKRAPELVARAEKAGLMGPAQKTLGDYYRSSGQRAQAITAYEKATEAGERGAMLPLAKLLLKGEGVKRDEKRALELVERAEKAGLVGPAQNTLGDYYRDLHRYRSAVAAYEAALLAGEIWAAVPLAEMLYRGQGAKQDRKRAAQLADRVEAAGLKWDGAELWYQTMILDPSNAQKKKCTTVKPLRVTDYDTNVTALPKTSESLIKRFAADVANFKCQVIAVGFTSPSGNPEVNARIGLARAEAAKARLIALGVKARQERTQAATGSKAVSVSVVPYQTMILNPSNAQKNKCATIKPLRVADYDTNVTALPKTSESLIKRFAADVAKFKCRVIAVGYTSPSGSPQVNERIGLARAEAAKARLVELGVKVRQVRTQAATGSKAVSVSVVP